MLWIEVSPWQRPLRLMGTVVTADLWVSCLNNLYFEFNYSRNKQQVADDVNVVFVEHVCHGNDGLINSWFPVCKVAISWSISWYEVETRGGTWWTYLHTCRDRQVGVGMCVCVCVQSRAACSGAMCPADLDFFILQIALWRSVWLIGRMKSSDGLKHRQVERQVRETGEKTDRWLDRQTDRWRDRYLSFWAWTKSRTQSRAASRHISLRSLPEKPSVSLATSRRSTDTSTCRETDRCQWTQHVWM